MSLTFLPLVPAVLAAQETPRIRGTESQAEADTLPTRQVLPRKKMQVSEYLHRLRRKPGVSPEAAVLIHSTPPPRTLCTGHLLEDKLHKQHTVRRTEPYASSTRRAAGCWAGLFQVFNLRSSSAQGSRKATWSPSLCVTLTQGASLTPRPGTLAPEPFLGVCRPATHRSWRCTCVGSRREGAAYRLRCTWLALMTRSRRPSLIGQCRLRQTLLLNIRFTSF